MIRIISIIGAFGFFALGTTELDIHEEQDDDLLKHNEKQTAYQESVYILE